MIFEGSFRKKTFFLILFAIGLLLFCFVKFSLAASAYGSEIKTSSYIISRSYIERSVQQGNLFSDSIEITNLGGSSFSLSFSTSDSLSNFIDFNSSSLKISPKSKSTLTFLVVGKSPGNYSGSLNIQGDITETIPINLTVSSNSVQAPILLSTKSSKNEYNLDGRMDMLVGIQKLKFSNPYNATLNYSFVSLDNKTYSLGSENVVVNDSFQILKNFHVPKDLKEGVYVVLTKLHYNGKTLESKFPLKLKIAFLKMMVFGIIPMWILLSIIGFILVSLFSYFFIKRMIKKNKKYQMQIDTKTIPKKSPEFLFLGKIAEKSTPAYLDPLKLTTHTIVAGATGGGKSISAQVIIEEALMQDVAVIVFDPTAQWSGMLRKCTDKKMLSYYPKFGLKENDARAFKGNVREIKNARESIDIQKYMNPGQIQIFSMNKLQPKDIDIFVSNAIRGIFESDPKEAPNLKLLIVFDEVHRLLSKFGGSGEGFLQVERASREFRKWGMGVMLVSQVLADFVGEIKANISTEVQMRTRDEGDLERIKTKYGDDFLKSLVKASVGVGMFVNPAYNHGKPYFVNFRPILHSTRRLSDEELEKYNKYNDMIEDLEDQIAQLEGLKVDTFDFKMEIKLMKDKIMSGSFSVVEIYLEGLKPRVEKEWKKLGKKPKPRQLKLVSEDAIKKSLEEAKKSREEFLKKEEANKPVEAAKEAPKENIDEKIVNPLTFDNGIMISSLKELKEVLPNLDEEIFKTHVNDEKNDIAKWVGENFSPEDSKLAEVKTKDEMIKALDKVGKGKPSVKKSSGSKKSSEENKESKSSTKKKAGNKKLKKKITKKKKTVKKKGGNKK